MEKSATISELVKALISFNKEVKTIGYDASNPFFKSGYATLGALVSETRDILTKNNLVVSQPVEDSGSVITLLMHTSGEFISSKLTLKPVRDDTQGNGSCVSYARRYSYAAILGLISEKDDDGNAATHGKKQSATDLPKPITLKDRIVGTAQTKFKSQDEFKAWRIDNKLVEDLEKATNQDLNFIIALLREYKEKK